MAEFGYGYERTLGDITFEEAVERITAALEAEGFGMLTTIDVTGTLQKKLGVEFRKYAILGACNPHFAHQALANDPHLGLLLPCNVVVQESPEAEGVTISVASPRAMLSLVDRPEMAGIADAVERHVLRALEAV